MRSLGVLTFVLLAGMAVGAPTDVVTAHGRYFNHGDQTFEFIGVNIRGISHYGQPAPLQYTSLANIDDNLNGAAGMGCKVIRLFAANKHQSDQNNIDHLKYVLDRMEPLGLKAIVCFTDVYTTDFHPAGDDSYYMPQTGGYTLLDDSWFSTGYTVNYLPWVQATVTQLKDHNRVFAWELGNELTDIKTPNNILTFTANVAAAIKAIDPDHMVTTGYISVDHTQVGVDNGIAMYNDPNIDFMTVHSYTGDDPLTHWEVYARVEKPLIMEEYGWDVNQGDRVANTTAQLNKWFNERNVRGFMNWGYQATNYDIGDGDNMFGIDPRFADFTQLHDLYLTWSQNLAAGAGALPVLGLPPGTNVAPESTNVQTDSNYSASYGGDKAIDGVVSASSKWTSAGTALPHWLALDLGTPKEIAGFVVRMANDAGEERHYSFTDFEVQSGPSISGPWTTRFDVQNPTQYSVQILREASPATLRYIRLLVNDAGVDNYARLPEFEVYEAEPTAAGTWYLY